MLISFQAEATSEELPILLLWVFFSLGNRNNIVRSFNANQISNQDTLYSEQLVGEACRTNLYMFAYSVDQMA